MSQDDKDKLYELLERLKDDLAADEELTDHGKDLINSGINNVQTFLS